MTESLTLIQMGDLHGHLVPRPNLRADGSGRTEGGLARLATLVGRIRAECPATLLANTGDTIQGGAEVLHTRGQAMVDVLDHFGVDVYAPGNWDFLYGRERFLELFGPGTGPGGHGTRWGALAANAYDAGSGALLLPPRRVAHVGGVRVGLVGLTTERTLVALGDWATEGIRFTGDGAELGEHVAALREQGGVDLVVVVSEFGLAKNIRLAERIDGIDVILSSDMHEETREPVRTRTGTLVSEVGQDGTRLARLDLAVGPAGIADWRYTLHVVDEDLPADPGIERIVGRVRRPFLAGEGRTAHRNPINGAVLDRPIDEVVGRTAIPLHRSGFAHDPMPAVLAGTSSDSLSTALRDAAGVDVAQFRGFRYGTHVAPGPIRWEDLYHYLAVGAQIARTTVTGADLRRSIEASLDGSLNPDPFAWTGGWVHAYAGVRFTLDPERGAGRRARDVQVRRHGADEWGPLEDTAEYSYAGYWFDRVPETVGGIRARGPVHVLRDPGAAVTDATTVVADHLADHVVTAEEPRILLARPLPPAIGPNPEIQPLNGAG